MQRCLHMSPAYPEANTPTIIDAGVSESTLHLALGNRCISVGDKAQIANSTLLGIAYLSTRSMERDHIDVDFARSVGIRVALYDTVENTFSSASSSSPRMRLRHLTTQLVLRVPIGCAGYSRSTSAVLTGPNRPMLSITSSSRSGVLVCTSRTKQSSPVTR